ALHTEALGIDETASGDDADREAGVIEGFHSTRDIGLQLRRERLDPRLHRVLREADAGRAHDNRGKRGAEISARGAGPATEALGPYAVDAQRAHAPLSVLRKETVPVRCADPRMPWNKDKVIGAKLPLRAKDVW